MTAKNLKWRYVHTCKKKKASTDNYCQVETAGHFEIVIIMALWYYHRVVLSFSNSYYPLIVTLLQSLLF